MPPRVSTTLITGKLSCFFFFPSLHLRIINHHKQADKTSTFYKKGLVSLNSVSTINMKWELMLDMIQQGAQGFVRMFS